MSATSTPNVREFQWDSLKGVYEYALAKGLTHLQPLFPFNAEGGTVRMPAGWGMCTNAN